MADAVLAGDGLDAIAALTAEATGGTVAIVLPAVGAAVAGAGGERRLGAVRRFVAARLAGQPGALPQGYVADAAVGRDGEKVGAVVLLGEARPPAAGAQAVLRLAAVAALTLAALGDATADGPRAAGALLEELRRAPWSPTRSSRAPGGWASTSPGAPLPCGWRRLPPTACAPPRSCTTLPRGAWSCVAAMKSTRS
jgi:hypothetical protein